MHLKYLKIYTGIIVIKFITKTWFRKDISKYKTLVTYVRKLVKRIYKLSRI